ncbi:MAG: DNA polymerase III subunit alpha [Gammaproteobacteria bacterium]
MNLTFIHLRIHTEYSLSDGLVQISPLIEKTVKDQMPAVAISDQSNLFAVVKFYKEAVNAGVKPLIAVDVWLENDKQPAKPFRLTLFCQNDHGYKHLLELISKSFLQGQTQDKAIIKREWLKEYADGLIALSGAEDGDVGQALLADDAKHAAQLIAFWKDCFPNRYYLELRRTGRATEEQYIHAAVQLAEQHGIPVVATNDVRFLERDDFEAHEARVCIHEGHILADPRRPKIYSEQQYFRSQSEMAELFSDIPEALQNTVEIAKRCNVTLILGKNYLPRFPVPENFTTETYLVAVSKQGLDERLAISFDVSAETFSEERKAYDERLQTELDVINNMGFAGYFLIVADFTRWARDNGVPVGPGRGSGPGSLVAYALKITDLDPLAHELLFERFLNPERVSMPDFDIDFCMEGRDRVIDYVMQTHGRESVAQIITYGTMAARAVLRDVGRVLGMGYGHIDKLAKLIPFEIGMTLDKALAQEEILRTRYQQEDDVRTLIDLALKLEGTTRNVGKHAGGVVIAPAKLTEFTPLYCEPNEAQHLVTQFDKDDVEAVGLVKFDFLGLRTLTIIDWAVKNIFEVASRTNTSLNIDIHLIPTHDEATFTLLKSCRTTAVFQLESRGMKDLIKRLQPDCFEDIVALVALFRPGPLQSGMVDDFINRKHGRAKVSYPHPKLEPILRPTYGVIVYQEQVMQIAQVLAGYSLGSADILRRAMGKKKPEEMAVQREIFCKGAVERGVSSDTANHIFDLMEKFAGYGFNKSHSASYALIAYQTAWLKAHYPAAYMAAVLSSDMDNTDKVVLFVDDCYALKLQILAPDINQSEYAFKVIDDKSIAYGLGAIKGAGQAAIEAIVETRKQSGPFTDLFDFCHRVDPRKMNRRVLDALIKAGAFDKIGPHRASIMASLEHALHQAEQASRDRALGQHDLFGGAAVSKSHPIKYANLPEWSEQDRLFGEKETLGLYLTGHPIHRYLNELKHFTTDRIAELRPAANQTSVVAGIVTNVRSIQTKRGDRMAVVALDDATAQIDVLCFSENYQKYRDFLVKDKLIIVEGEISFDEFSGGNRVLCRDIFSIDQARERYARFLKINLSAAKSESLPKLQELLEKYRGGNCRVMINYICDNAKANLHLGETWRVNPSDKLLQLLEEIFAEQAEVIY